MQQQVAAQGRKRRDGGGTSKTAGRGILLDTSRFHVKSQRQVCPDAVSVVGLEGATGVVAPASKETAKDQDAKEELPRQLFRRLR